MAHLRVESDDGVRQIVLDRARLTIGRVPTNDVVIAHQQISRYHAELRASDEGWWIADLESTNGVQVRGRRVERHLLREGERVQLAPGVTVALVEGDRPDDVSVQPTAYVPAFAPTARPEGPARMWLPPSSATAWGKPGVFARDSAGPAAPPRPEEGDLFRRKRSRLTGAPSGDATPDASQPRYGAAASYLHLCQTCGQQTAPDAVRCQACGSPIAQPCRSCGLSLLPVQDLCPRCQCANPDSVLRARRTPTSA